MTDEERHIRQQLDGAAIYALRRAARKLESLDLGAPDQVNDATMKATRKFDVAFLRKIADDLEKKTSA